MSELADKPHNIDHEPLADNEEMALKYGLEPDHPAVQEIIDARDVLTSTLNELGRKMVELAETKRELGETALRLAEVRADSFDKLTSLPLPSLATRVANEMFLHVGGDRSIDPIGVVCTQTDIEKFKEINAAVNRDGGDKYIISKGAFLKSIVRDTDILSRWGGDEFVIVSPVFPGSSVEQVIEELDKRLYAIPQSPKFAKRIRWDHAIWVQGDDLDSILDRIDITTDEGKARAKESAVNQLYSLS